MSQLDTSSHGEVYLSCKQVSAQWRDLAIRLGLEKSTIDIIKANNVQDVEGCMYEVIDKWLKRDVRKGVDRPSWKSLCVALSHIDGPLAESISMEHGCGYINPVVSKVADQSGVSPVFLPFSCGCGQCTIRGWMTGHFCQNIVYTDSAHPKLVQILEKDNPLFYELQSSYYRATLANETRYLTDCFRDICIRTWSGLENLVEEGKYSVANFVLKLNAWLSGKPLPMATNLIELQHHLHSIRVTWFNYGPLEYLAKTFLSENPTLITNWNDYCRTLQDYCSIRDLRSRFVSVFFNLPVEGQNVFSLEVDEFSYDFTLADVKYLSDSLSRALGIPSVCLHLITVGTGSLLLYFYYCYSDYLVIFKALSTQQLQIISQIKEYRIMSLTDLHNRFTYDNIQNYQDEAVTILPSSKQASSSLITIPSNQTSTSEDTQLYRAHLFCRKINMNQWEFILVAIKQLDIYIQFITEKFDKSAKQICSFDFQFAGPSIELNFPGNHLPTGWTITTDSLTISKKDIDLNAIKTTIESHERKEEYSTDLPNMCKAEALLHIEDSASTASHVECSVEISGIKEKKCVIISVKRESPNSSILDLSWDMTETSRPTLEKASLLRESIGISTHNRLTMESAFKLLKIKSSQWHSIGAAIGISLDARESLRCDPSINDTSRLEHILANWLESSTPTWSDFMNVIKSLEFNDVAEQLSHDQESND